MSWCDKLASTPSVGFKLDCHFAPGEFVLQAFSPILDKLINDDEPQFQIDRQEPFKIEFTTHSGFHYGVEPTRIFVNFQHRIRAKPVSGGPPIMEMLSRALPFTELLPEVSDRLIEATLLLPDVKERTVKRVGIVAVTTVAEEEMPPGIMRFIKYMGRPWDGVTGGFTFQITSELGKSHGYVDRCAHTLTKAEGPDKLVALQFDWQRIFTAGRPINSSVLNEEMEKAQKSSLDYFEDLAEGNRFDEQIISKTT